MGTEMYIYITKQPGKLPIKPEQPLLRGWPEMQLRMLILNLFYGQE